MSTPTATALVRAPLWPLAVAGAAAAGSAILLLLAMGLGFRASYAPVVAGYVLGALVAPSAVVVYRHLSLAARRSVWFSPRSFDRPLAYVLLVAGLVLGVVHGFVLATELAK